MDDCGLRVKLWECVGSADWDEGHSTLDLLEARYILDLWRHVRAMKKREHALYSINKSSFRYKTFNILAIKIQCLKS